MKIWLITSVFILLSCRQSENNNSVDPKIPSDESAKISHPYSTNYVIDVIDVHNFSKIQPANANFDIQKEFTQYINKQNNKNWQYARQLDLRGIEHRNNTEFEQGAIAYLEAEKLIRGKSEKKEITELFLAEVLLNRARIYNYEKRTIEAFEFVSEAKKTFQLLAKSEDEEIAFFATFFLANCYDVLDGIPHEGYQTATGYTHLIYPRTAVWLKRDVLGISGYELGRSYHNMAKLFGTTQTEWDSSIHYLELALVEYNKVTDGNHKYYMEFLSETHSKLATYLLHYKKDTTSARIHIEKSLAYLLNKPFYTLNQPIGVEYDLREMMSRGKAIGQTLADLYKQNPQKIFLQRSQELIDLSLHLIQNTITKNPRHSGKWSDELAWGIEIEAYVRFIDEQFPLTSQKAEEFISLMESAQDISYKKSRSEMSFKNSEMNVLHRQLRTLEVRQQALERERANLPEDHYRNKNIQLLSSIDSLQNNISPIDIGDPNSEISSARDIQQVLGPGDVYFSYMANTGNSFNCAVITADTMLVHQISRDVWPDLIGFGISTQNQKNISKEWCVQSNRIYKLLFEPFIPHGENLNITIVRDQETQNIPFDALVVEMPEQIRGNENDIVYLAHLHSVNYEFSGTSFCASRQQKDQIIKSQLLAFAPIYNSNKAETSEEKVIVPDLRSACYSLIHNKEEVKEIAIDQNDIAIFGMEANEERFLQEIKKSPNIIHLAMHAFSNISDPLLSGLVFSNIDQTDYRKSSNKMNETAEDGILHAFEIYQMNITSKLIVLSACETGHGEFFRGEGTRSLGQAFRYAGCDNIIMSLWKVNDGSTKEIMVNFYNELRNGIGKSEALSKAKRKFLKEHPKTGPFYWAPFTLLGDNEPIFQKNNPPTFWWLAGLGLIISTFFFFKRVYKPIQ